jgi:hypothetical protein
MEQGLFGDRVWWIDCRCLGMLLLHEDWYTCLRHTAPMTGHDAPPRKY